MNREKGTVRVIACGGAGANIGQQILPWTKTEKDGFANLSVNFVDTSTSNLTTEVDKKDVYLFENKDGSGQKRSLNHDDIVPRIKDIVQKFKPANLNIVLHSLSGGSGSIAGPLLVKELLEQGHPVIALVIGDQSTKLFTNNTLNTLKSYEHIAKTVEAPVVMSYYYNENSEHRKEVDNYVKNRISDLLCLFSNHNVGMDSQDLYHWLRYDKVTDFPPQVSCLDVELSEEEHSDLYGYPITVATLATEDANTDYISAVEYQTTGYITTDVSSTVYKDKTVHFVISDGLFDRVAENLNKRLNEIQKAKESRVIRKNLVSEKDKPTDSGLIL